MRHPHRYLIDLIVGELREVRSIFYLLTANLALYRPKIFLAQPVIYGFEARARRPGSSEPIDSFSRQHLHQTPRFSAAPTLRLSIDRPAIRAAAPAGSIQNRS